MATASPSSKSPYLSHTDLILQLSSLRNTPPSSLPRSVYLLPSPLDPLLLDGVVFVGSAGPYAGGIFRFTLRWPSSASRGRKAGAREGPTICFNPTCVPAHPLIQPAAPHRLNLAPLLAQHENDDDPHSTAFSLPSLLTYLHQIFQPTYLRDVLATRPDWFTGYNVDVGGMLVKEYGEAKGKGEGRTGKGLFDSLARQSVKLSRSRRVLFGDGGGAGGEGQEGGGIVFPEALLAKGAGGTADAGGGAEAERKREEWMAQLRRDIFYGDEDDDDGEPAR